MYIYIFYEGNHNIIKNIIFNIYVLYCIVMLVMYFIIYIFYLVSLVRIILDICVRYEFISTQPYYLEVRDWSQSA